MVVPPAHDCLFDYLTICGIFPQAEFTEDGTFRMTPAEGETIKGRFWFAGKLINPVVNGDERQTMKIMLNEASNLFEFTVGNASFAMKGNDVMKLVACREK